MLNQEKQRRGQSDLQLLIKAVSTRFKKPDVKRTPRFLFRALVRTVINNLKWLKEEEIEGETKTIFTKKIKGLLRTDVSERTTDDKALIRRLLGNLNCLLRYPANVRENLATTAMFSYFGPGRKLVSEGHPSIAMYFIISGKVNVSKMTFDPGVREYKSVVVDVMEAGDSFGEVNILYDEPWPTTVTSMTGIEILSVEKEIFQKILENFLGEQKKTITNMIKNLSFFKHWNQRTIFECCILARIETYHKDDLIFGDNFKNTRNAYFIISGQCLVVYHLQLEIIDRIKNIVKIAEKSSERLSVYGKLQPIPNVSLSALSCYASSKTSVYSKPRSISRFSASTMSVLSELIREEDLQSLINSLSSKHSSEKDSGKSDVAEVESHFIRVGILFPGQCFGIGEDVTDKFFLSNEEPVTVLAIPRDFLNLHNRANIWQRMIAFFDRSYPSPEKILKNFLSERKWAINRKGYVESVMKKKDKPFTGLTAAEVPYYFRLTEDITNPIFNRVRKTVRKVKIVTEERSER